MQVQLPAGRKGIRKRDANEGKKYGFELFK